VTLYVTSDKIAARGSHSSDGYSEGDSYGQPKGGDSYGQPKGGDNYGQPKGDTYSAPKGGNSSNTPQDPFDAPEN